MLRKPLLTTHEVAELLRVKEATVRRWIRDGELSAVNLGRDWRVAVIQLEEFLKQRVTRGTSMPERSEQGVERAIQNEEAAAPPLKSSNSKSRQSGKPGRSRNQT
jgi:excisionase family DNA binding protein